MKQKFKKATILAPTMLAAGVLVTPVFSHAGESIQENKMTKEKGISMSAGALAGAAVGGPFGAAVGAIAGGMLGDHVEATNELERQEQEMNIARRDIYQLESEVNQMELVLNDMESEVVALEEALTTRLEFQVLFRTGDDRLQETDRERVAMLANYMRQNTEVSVRLEGHTDARGTDGYNSVLAEQRALAVANALFARGIDQDRVQIESFGSSKAKTLPGDYEGYALDRRVNIEVLGKKTMQADGISEPRPEQAEIALIQ